MACTTPDLRLLSQSHYRPLTGTKLYCLVTEAHVCEQLTQGCYLKARGRESNLRPSESQVQRPNHYAIRPHPYRRRSKNQTGVKTTGVGTKGTCWTYVPSLLNEGVQTVCLYPHALLATFIFRTSLKML